MAPADGVASRRPRAPLPRLTRVLVAASLLYLLAPPAWMLAVRASPRIAELRARPPHWMPDGPDLPNYRTLFRTEGTDRRVLIGTPRSGPFPARS